MIGAMIKCNGCQKETKADLQIKNDQIKILSHPDWTIAGDELYCPACRPKPAPKKAKK